MKEIKILNNIEIAPRSYLLKFKRFFDFKAGQVIKITCCEEIPPRIYSIASAETDELIEILYKVIPTGDLTPKLEEAKAGTSIFVSDPFGSFTFKGGASYFIATGTGIAPYIAMLRSGYNSENICLIHGSRTKDELYYFSELKTLIGNNYTACLTGEIHEKTFHGRVSKFIEQKSDLRPDIMYYLCGSAEMVVEMRDLLIKKKVPFSNIFSEIYF